MTKVIGAFQALAIDGGVLDGHRVRSDHQRTALTFKLGHVVQRLVVALGACEEGLNQVRVFAKRALHA